MLVKGWMIVELSTMTVVGRALTRATCNMAQRSWPWVSRRRQNIGVCWLGCNANRRI